MSENKKVLLAMCGGIVFGWSLTVATALALNIDMAANVKRALAILGV
jgi:hypothetical protein